MLARHYVCFLLKGPYGDGANVDTRQLKPGVFTTSLGSWDSFHSVSTSSLLHHLPHIITTFTHHHHLFPPSYHHLLTSDSLPPPECPLLDIKVILGDETRYLALMHLFKKELTSNSFKPWKSVIWFTDE